MLDKMLGKNDKNQKGPDLRKNEKDSGSNMGGRLRDMVYKATNNSKETIGKVNSKVNETKGKNSSNKKMPRPIPKPRPKGDTEKLRLKPPKKKSGGTTAGLIGGFGRRMPGGGDPDDDRRTLVGAAVFGIILIILVGAGYYFLVYGPYQSSLQSAKNAKINEVNDYYKGALALDPTKQTLLAEIDSAVTPEQALAVDVLGPATADWRQYQSQQINTKKDAYGRVMITYSAGGQKNLITKTTDAQKIVNEADASVLSNMAIKTPDTVVVPIIVTRLQAAGGLINVGDAVDVYLNTNAVSTTNQTNQTNATVTNNTNPQISGATVLAILRAKDSGAVAASLNTTQGIAINQLSSSSSRGQSASTDVEQLLRAAASGTWDEATVSTMLTAYGWKLSDFERASNLGELDVNYLILLEVPRENALFLMQNMNSIMLTVPTQQAPEWMVQELKQIYGTG